MARPAGVLFLFLLLSCSCLPRPIEAQSPREIVQQAVNTELNASENDHSLWRFRQEEKVPVDTLSIVVQTHQGSIKQKIQQNGQPLTPQQQAAEMRRIQSFVHDPSAQQRQRQNSEHDDKSARELLKILPDAFDWTVAHQDQQNITLAFRPNPSFDPPDMESRVMGAMGGEMIVDRGQHRIRSIRGRLLDDVTFGFGILGRLHAGGTFNVERREITPGLWQITETHVHIEGRALFFKTIGQQEDEINTDYSRVPDSTTLEQAVGLLNAPH